MNGRTTNGLLGLSATVCLCFAFWLGGCGESEEPAPPSGNRNPVIDSLSAYVDTVLEADTVSFTV